jgi:hypothetical protein
MASIRGSDDPGTDARSPSPVGATVGIPAWRQREISQKVFISRNPEPAGSPEAVRAWFYPGKNYRHEFVYPKAKAVQLAKANNTLVPSMPDELAANTTGPATTMQEPQVVELKQAPLKAQQPTEEELEIAEANSVPRSTRCDFFSPGQAADDGQFTSTCRSAGPAFSRELWVAAAADRSQPH